MGRRSRLLLVTPLAFALLAAISLRSRAGPEFAAADVDHAVGFRAVVYGYSSWFGVYGMGGLGRVVHRSWDRRP